MKRLLSIRADASPTIGAGHVMRCYALAEAWQRRGGQVEFCSNGLPAILSRRLKNKGFDIYSDDLSELEKSAETHGGYIKRLEETAPDWVVIDGYHFSSQLYEKLFQSPWPTLVLDDSFGHYPGADIVLNQNLYAEKQSCKDNNGIKLFGPHYALLRDEFLTHDRSKQIIHRKVQRVLLTFGGSDPVGMTLKVLNSIQDLSDKLHIDVIVGALNPDIAEIRELAEASEIPIQIHFNVDRLTTLLNYSDLVITAGGSTCLELAYCGVPFIVIPVVDNQEPIAAFAAKSGIGKIIPPDTIDSVGFQESLISAFDQLASNYRLRQHMSQTAQKMVDGKGANRVVDKMLEIKGIAKKAA